MSELNLRQLRPSRAPIRAGDIFAMQLPSGRYLFGRVIEADIPRERAPMPKANLIYIYRSQSERVDPSSVSLMPSDLLLPPVFTNRLAWSRGYFETVGHKLRSRRSTYFCTVASGTRLARASLMPTEADSLVRCLPRATGGYRAIVGLTTGSARRSSPRASE